MQFRTCRKVSITYARPLTQVDFDQRQGSIQTPEGSMPFLVGDYLAHDQKGEWPIQHTLIHRDYALISGPDPEGFSSYQPNDLREACQIERPFTSGSLTGQPGDYLVRSQGVEWIVDRAIFESVYTFVEENMTHA